MGVAVRRYIDILNNTSQITFPYSTCISYFVMYCVYGESGPSLLMFFRSCLLFLCNVIINHF